MYISNTDKNNKINENTEQNRNNNFNIKNKISNKRNKQRKNYKFYEIHDNIKSNNNRNKIQTTNNNQKDSNQKRCICSLGRNKLNDKRLLQYNNNFITYLPKTTLNKTQKNLSYILRLIFF